MHSLENYLNVLYRGDHSPNRKINEHECFRLLWIKVILRASYDWVLYRNSKNHIYKKIADDAFRWLFDPPKEKRRVVLGNSVRVVLIQEFNALENICDAIDLDIDSVRRFAKQLTRDDIKKMEFLERNSHKRISLDD